MLIFLLRIFGFFLLFLGLVGMLTPIPLGILFFLVGLIILLPITPAMVRFVQALRGRSKKADAAFSKATDLTPRAYRRHLRRTEARFDRYRW